MPIPSWTPMRQWAPPIMPTEGFWRGSSPGHIPEAPGQGQRVTLPNGTVMIDGRVISGPGGRAIASGMPFPMQQPTFPGTTAMPRFNPLGGTWNPKTMQMNYGGNQGGNSFSLRWDQDGTPPRPPSMPQTASSTQPAAATGSNSPWNLSNLGPSMAEEYQNWGG